MTGPCWRLLPLLGLVLLAGCGPQTAHVDGSVTVDGKPLEKGLITFAPADKNGVQARTEIKDGKYALTMMPGKKFVQISAPVVVDRRKDSSAPNATLVDITEESLPEETTNGTSLTYDAAAGKQTKDWTLKGKSKS